ncbi:MAG: hypothetical protein KY428_06330 [Bacteroidetes bacterium]|nr:hypothetical protein [Bacteroidota bacterium]
MSDNPYESFPDLEIIELRKKVRELESSLAQAQAILRENDLLDAKATISDEEQIALRLISKFKELTDKNIPWENDDYKNYDITVKALLAIRGKSVPDPSKKPKKKEEAPDITKLLKIAQGSEE